MTLKNAQPRFGLMDDGRLMDYVKGAVVETKGTVEDADGTWDLVKVAELIHAGKPIESAMVSGGNAQSSKAVSTLDKIKQAWHDFESKFESDHPDDKVAQAGRDFHSTIEKHLDTAAADEDAYASRTVPLADDEAGRPLFSDPKKLKDGSTTYGGADADREARRRAAAADGSGKAAFPNPGQPVENLGVGGAMTPGTVTGTGLTKGQPGNEALQTNKAYTDSTKDVAIVDGHDDIKEKQLGSESSVMKEMGKEG